MKKDRAFILPLTVLSCFVLSCSDNEESNQDLNETINFYDKAYIETAELDEKLAYRNFHLTHLMESVLKFNPNFDKDIVTSKGKDRFLGGTTFHQLLSNIVVNKGENQTDSTQLSLNAFIDIENETLYPYIEKVKTGDGVSPLYLIKSYDQELEKEVVQGYEIASNGKLILTYHNLSEDDVFGSEANKVSTGDVYLLGTIPCYDPVGIEKSSCDGEGSTGGGTTVTTYKGKFGYMKIKDKKESWIERGEVHRKAYYSSTAKNYSGQDGAGTQIGKWRNRNIGDIRSVNHTFVSNSVQNSLNIVAYVIFENDNWPATLRQYNSYVDGKNIKFRYRSYQTPYDQRTISLNPSDPYGLGYVSAITYSNSDIEYNVVNR